MTRLTIDIMSSWLAFSPTEIIQRTEDKAHLFHIYQTQGARDIAKKTAHFHELTVLTKLHLRLF